MHLRLRHRRHHIHPMADLFLPTLMADIIDNGVVVGNIPYIWKIGGFILFIVAAFGAAASICASYFMEAAIELAKCSSRY